MNNETGLWGRYGASILAPEANDDTLLDMTAVKCMFVSIGLFTVPTLISFVRLLVKGKIALP